MPQHPGHRFHIYPVLRGQGSEDIPEIMEPDFWVVLPVSAPGGAFAGRCLERWTVCGTREHPGAFPDFLFLLIQNVYHILFQRQDAVGVFCFQWGLHHLSINMGNLPPYPEVALFQVKVLPPSDLEVHLSVLRWPTP